MKIREMAACVGFTSDVQLGKFFGVTTDDIRGWNVSEIPQDVIKILEEMYRKGIDADSFKGPRSAGKEAVH